MTCPTCGAAVKRDLGDRPLGTPPLDNRWLVPMLIGALTLGLFVIIATLFQTTITLWSQGQLNREVLASVSPEGKYRVLVRIDHHVPVIDIDPPVTIRLSLSNIQTGETLDYISIGIEEDSDTGAPEVRWRDPGVAEVTKLHFRNEVSATLDARRRTQQ